MDSTGIMIFATGALALGFFSLLAWWGFRNENRKAEMTHLERQTSLERGIPLQDAEVARCRSLGWIGAIVPVVSLSLAVGATALLLKQGTSESNVVGLVAVWTACGAVAVAGVVATVVRLQQTSQVSTGGNPNGDLDAAPGTSR